MTIQLILVKHSLPEMIETLPARDWKLSEEGCLRAERLAGRLASYHPKRLFSSPEPKAMETALIVGRTLPLDVHVIQDLHEHERSISGHLPKAEFEAAIQTFFSNPDRLVFGSETANQAYQRFSRTVHYVLAEDGEKTTVIVSHGTVISLFISRLTRQPEIEIWRKLGLPGFIVLDLPSNELVAFENIF